jgi:hypothetical protein
MSQNFNIKSRSYSISYDKTSALPQYSNKMGLVQRFHMTMHKNYSDWLRAGRSGFDTWQGVGNFSCSDRLWDQPSLLSNGYRGGGCFPGGQADGA